MSGCRYSPSSISIVQHVYLPYPFSHVKITSFLFCGRTIPPHLPPTPGRFENLLLLHNEHKRPNQFPTSDSPICLTDQAHALNNSFNSTHFSPVKICKYRNVPGSKVRLFYCERQGTLLTTLSHS